MTRLAQFNAAGITATTISRMERAGEVVLLSRGLCQLPDAELATQQSLAGAARLVPKGVICLASALAFHGLTERCIRCGTYRSTQALEKSIRQYVDLNNEDPKLCVRTKTADDILASIERLCLRTLHQDTRVEIA